MRFFIDEGGTFVPETGWGVVCSLAFPHKEVGPARREIKWVSREWQRSKDELKGGLLKPAHLEALVEILFRHDAILHANAIDVSREDLDRVDSHKVNQCDGITKYLAPTHHPKDPRRITTQEQWWRDTLAPLLESRSRRRPIRLVRDPAFDYRFLDRSFRMRKEMWYPDRPRQAVDGYDIKKMITDRMTFLDSRSEILIQTVDILASFLRRLLAGEVGGDEIARALGRLQIIRRNGGQTQSLNVLTIARRSGRKTGLYKTLRAMTAAGRSMMKGSG